MEIYLIRHTTPDIKKGICYGQSDLPLSNSFPKEFESISKNLPKEPFDAVFSSPLQRCSRLAEKLSSTEVFYDQRLMELNFGNWELREWNDIEQSELKPWMESFVNYPCPNGESFLELHQRVMEFKDELLKSNHDRVIVVTHGGVIRSFLSFVKSTPLSEAFSYKVNYGEIQKVSL